MCKCKPYPMQHRMRGGESLCRPGISVQVAVRHTVTCVTDRWQSRNQLRTEPGLQACWKNDPFRVVFDFGSRTVCVHPEDEFFAFICRKGLDKAGVDMI